MTEQICKCGHGDSVHFLWKRLGGRPCSIHSCDCKSFHPLEVPPEEAVTEEMKQVLASFEAPAVQIFTEDQLSEAVEHMTITYKARIAELEAQLAAATVELDRLRDGLRQALRYWITYAKEFHEDLETATHAEAKIYRAIRDSLGKESA